MRRVHAVGAHRNAAKLRAHSRQQILQAGIERIFHRHRIAGPQQHAADQVQRLLAAVGDQQVVPRTRQLLPSRLFHQVAPQWFVSARRTQLQNVRQVAACQHCCATGAKLVQREQVSRGTRNREADHVLAPSAIGTGNGSVVTLEQSIPVHPARRLGATGHEAPAAHLPRNQAFGFENFIGCRYCSPVQSKQTSQFASGGQSLAVSQHPSANLLRYLVRKLPVQRRLGAMIEFWLEFHSAIPYHIGLPEGGLALLLPWRA